MKLSEAAIGQRVVYIDPMGDDPRTQEPIYRWVHYERRPGEALFVPPSKPGKAPTLYVPVYRLRTVQGVQDQRPRWDSGEYRIESEMPASYPVVPADEVDHDSWEEPDTSVPAENPEPSFVLRAGDRHAREALEAYAGVLKPGPYRDQIAELIASFAAFARANPEEMRSPDA